VAVLSENALAARWLHEVFEPAMAAIPGRLRGKRAAAELYHELLVHRWYRGQEAGAPVPMRDAVSSYVREVLPAVPDEREPLALEPPAA
jgi:hypothetical protein